MKILIDYNYFVYLKLLLMADKGGEAESDACGKDGGIGRQLRLHRRLGVPNGWTN